MKNTLITQSSGDKSKDLGDFKDRLLEDLNFSLEKEVVEDISLQEVPEDIQEKFEGYSKRFILPAEYIQGNFNHIGSIQHNFPESYVTYFAMQDKEYDNGYIEKLIYLFEKDSGGLDIGHGEIRLCVKHGDHKVFQNYFKDKPFVGFTKTENSFLKQGYGLMRLIHMNNIVSHLFGLNLFSSDLFVNGTGAKRNREKLVEYGLAIHFIDDDGKDRFCFI